MITLFRKFRQRLLTENKFSKYTLYAIGEIILVVIGILIALQINNTNDLRKLRVKEVHYLKNIKSDLQINILELDRYIETRTQCIQAANNILEHFEGKPITDPSAFNALGISIYSWQKFYQSNNTFQELLNSGNLAIISKDSIKNMLLNIESLYKKMKSEEDHFRYDTEVLIYEPLYHMMDLYPLVNNFEYRVTGGASGRNISLSEKHFDDYLKNPILKNGFVMTILEFNVMNGQMQQMKEMSQKLIALIDEEITREK
jgi:hypothetical protein